MQSCDDSDAGAAADRIPNRFLMVWTGKRFPYFCRLAVESVLLADPDAEVELHVFGERPDQAPHFRAACSYRRVSVHEVDMGETFAGLDAPAARYQALLEAIPRTAYSARSNLVRYGLLHRRGGIYLDFDVLVVRDFAHLRAAPAFIGQELVWKADEDRVAGRIGPAMIVPAAAYAWTYLARRLDSRLLRGRRVFERLARPVDDAWRTVNLNNAVIGAEPGSRFVRRVLAGALRRDPTVRYNLGPTLVSAVARADSSDVLVLPPACFYGQPPSYSFRFFEERPRTLGSDAVLIHYVSSNHGKLLASLDPESLERKRDAAIFYQLGARVADAARQLPRR